MRTLWMLAFNFYLLENAFISVSVLEPNILGVVWDTFLQKWHTLSLWNNFGETVKENKRIESFLNGWYVLRLLTDSYEIKFYRLLYCNSSNTFTCTRLVYTYQMIEYASPKAGKYTKIHAKRYPPILPPNGFYRDDKNVSLKLY